MRDVCATLCVWTVVTGVRVANTKNLWLWRARDQFERVVVETRLAREGFIRVVRGGCRLCEELVRNEKQ